MDIINHTVLAWLEEDNQKLGHFRVRPLLRETGPFTPAEIEEWRDDGFIRVVPDKSEQRTCKERLRTLGEFCLLTLTGTLTDKFKQNKNYSPAKGEKNRYIVYSNAVEPLPENLFYEVIPESMLARAVTAQAYARIGGKIRGPVDRQTGRDQKDARQLPPDDSRIFSVTLPDGTVRLFYWPLAAEEPAEEQVPDQETETAEAEKTADEAEPMTALDQIKALDKQMMRMVKEAENPDAAEKPKDVLIPDDAGTPLYYAQVDTEAPVKRRNTLAQAVENNRRSAERPEKKPEKKNDKKKNARDDQKAALAAGSADGKPASDQLKAEWTQTGDRAKLAEKILSLPGAREQFALALGGMKDPVLAALKAQLQDTEAERLMTVMNLNQAKAQEAQYRETLAAGLVKSERQELDDLKAETESAVENLKKIRDQQAELLRDQERYAQNTGYRAVWPGEAADDAPVLTVAHRVMESMRTAGFECDLNRAVALLTVYAFCGRNGMCLSGQSILDSHDAVEAFANALGGTAVDEEDSLRVMRGGSAALLVIHSDIWSSVPTGDHYTDVYLPGVLSSDEDDGLVVPEVPVFQSGTLPGTATAYPALDSRALRGKLQQAGTAMNEKALEVIAQFRKLCAESGIVIPLRMIRDLTAFAAAAQNLMEGGISAALDWALLVYAVPVVLKYADDTKFLNTLPKTLPLTRQALGLK